MRVFVLTTGRSGSTTFAKACAYLTNFSTGHESRAGTAGNERLDYPDDHIEIDNRLSWMLGPLHQRFPEARYVHLTRDPEATAHSFLARWQVHPPSPEAPQSRHAGSSIISAFAYTVLMRGRPWPEDRRLEVSRMLVETVNANIREFLRDKPHVVVRLEHARDDFPAAWQWFGGHGDLAAAMDEWRTAHNATVPSGGPA